MTPSAADSKGPARSEGGAGGDNCRALKVLFHEGEGVRSVTLNSCRTLMALFEGMAGSVTFSSCRASMSGSLEATAEGATSTATDGWAAKELSGALTEAWVATELSGALTEVGAAKELSGALTEVWAACAIGDALTVTRAADRAKKSSRTCMIICVTDVGCKNEWDESLEENKQWEPFICMSV